MNYTQILREFIIENFLFGDDEQLQDNTLFIESGIIDSTGILELINFLEEEFQISVEDEEITPENFASINVVSSYLEKKINQN